jgi:hypothetical protein
MSEVRTHIQQLEAEAIHLQPQLIASFSVGKQNHSFKK